MDDNMSFENVYKILERKCITPVYQPIILLASGEIFGYEALSRISDDTLSMDIDHMFRTADKIGKAWELEALCRSKSLENAVHMDPSKKLFLNVNPNIIYDPQFINGFTQSRLKEYGLDNIDITFEITERVAVLYGSAFMSAVEHYKTQNYGIAIDDVGSGYSGLSVILSVRPNIIKLHTSLIRDIDKDEIKQLLCKALVDFGRGAGIKILAEGIETEEELETLIKLNADYGQGFFLGVPRKTFMNIEAEKKDMILKFHNKKYISTAKSSVYPIIGHLAKPGHIFPPDEKTSAIYESLQLNPTITEFAIVENGETIGFMTKTDFNELLGGRYGFSLHSKKNLRQIINTDFMRVNYHMSVDEVSRLAMTRPLNELYSPIVVERDGCYYGIVTIKDLLNTCTKIEVDMAAHSNPLTGLPGNLLIEKEIKSRVFGEKPYCVTYYDIDNFKAYNDAYGFQNGDMMLALVAEILQKCAEKNEFIGHIGGDDFIVVCDYHEGEEYCQSVIKEFAVQVNTLYRDEDIKNGYIISKNRNGVTENFPIASLSIAGISNKAAAYQSLDDFSRDIANLKKNAKKQLGNYYEIA